MTRFIKQRPSTAHRIFSKLYFFLWEKTPHRDSYMCYSIYIASFDGISIGTAILIYGLASLFIMWGISSQIGLMNGRHCEYLSKTLNITSSRQNFVFTISYCDAKSRLKKWHLHDIENSVTLKILSKPSNVKNTFLTPWTVKTISPLCQPTS